MKNFTINRALVAKKKLLLFFAAFCCAMLVTVQPANATDLKDGVIVRLGSHGNITDEEKNDVFPGTGKIVSYDDQTHTLYLENTNMSCRCSMWARPTLEIDATKLDADFTICVKGKVLVEGYGLPAFNFEGATGRKLIIEGGGEIEFKTYKNTSSSCSGDKYNTETVCCLCDYTLIRNNVSVKIDNTQANDNADNGYGIYTKNFELNHAQLEISARKATRDVVGSSTWTNVYQVDMTSTHLKYDYYDKLYPVWIGGTQLNDRLAMYEGFVYHEDTRELEISLVNYTAPAGEYAIKIEDTEDPVTPVTIVLDTYSSTITATSPNKYALYCKTPVIIRNELLKGKTVTFTADASPVIQLSAADLTMEGSGAGMLKCVGPGGNDGVINSDYSRITINSTNLTVSPTVYPWNIGAYSHTLNNVRFESPEGATWPDNSGFPIDAAGDPLKGEFVIVRDKNVLSASPSPADAGNVAVTVSGTAIETPYYFSEASLSDVQLTATPNEGYSFAYWDDTQSDNSDMKTVTVSGTKEYKANFTKDPQLKTSTSIIEEYILDGNVIKRLPSDMRDAMTYIATMSASTDLSVAAYHNEKIYYFETSSGKTTLYSVPFTPNKSTKLGTKKVEIAAQSDFIDPLGLVYSEKDNCLYAIMTRKYDGTSIGTYGQTCLCRISDGAYENVMGNQLYACSTLAIDDKGQLYTVYMSSANLRMMRINLTDKKLEEVGVLSIGTWSPKAFVYDTKLQKFFICNKQNTTTHFYQFDPSTKETSWVGYENLANTCAALFSVPVPQHTITVQTASGQSAWGNVEIVECACQSQLFDETLELTLQATPKSGYRFVEWEDHSTNPTRNITVGTSDATYTATFVPQHTVTVQVADGQSSLGDVEIADCSCKSKTFDEGASITLKATPKAGCGFVRWEDGSTTQLRKLKVGAFDATYTAYFTQLYTVSVATADGQSEWGTVEIVECGCQSYNVEANTFLTLKAESKPGYEFVEWSDHSKDQTHLVKILAADVTYTATFKKKDAPKHTVTATVSDFTCGNVYLTGGVTSGQYGEGDILTIYVSQNPGYVFDKWSDGNTDNPRTITVGTSDITYIAYFVSGNAYRISLAVATNQTEYGKVSFPAVPGMTSYQFKEGASVAIKAEPTPGYKFDKWDDGNTQESRTVTVGTEDKTYTASFKEADKVTIEVAVADGQADRGTVSLTGGKTSGDFPIGSSVTLTASAKPGFKFSKWDDGNNEPVRTITVAAAKKFIASFESAPETKTYPVTVAGIELTAAKSSLVAGTDLAGILKTGSVSYDEASATLTLNGIDLALSEATITGILIDGGTTNAKVTVNMVGTNKITAAGTGLALKNSLDITLNGDGTLTVKANDAIALDKANLTIYGLALTIDGANSGIAGSGTEKLTVAGAKVSVKGAVAGSIIKIKNLETQYCSMDADHSFNATTSQVEKDNKLATDEVIFDAFPMITVKPMEEGTGHFELSNGSTKFTDQGWFAPGTEIKIVAQAAPGFEFARWTDDSNWRDPSSKVKANGHDPIVMPSTSTTYDNYAVFYYKSKSSSNWYGVNNGDFISFKMSDFGANVKKAASPDALDVTVGDFVRNSWVVLNNSTVQAIPFSSLSDGGDLRDPVDLGSVSESFTDMTYDMIGNKIYAVDGTKLYTIAEKDGNVEQVAEFQFEGTAKNIVAIAANAKKTLYLLSSDDGGVLYSVPTNKIKDEVVPMSIVGEAANGGKIGMPVSNEAQSMAFDCATGELFWGASDYIRYINPRTAQCNIAGDLEQQEGKQGYIKALHNMSKPVNIYVQVADGQDDRGTVRVEGEKELKTVSGVSFTITASANSGYRFSHWEIKGSSGSVSDNEKYETSVTGETTFVAYFEEGDGIQTVTIQPTLNVQKVLINGSIYILRDGRIYTITGGRVE